ncbi:alkaline phosphatase D family protein [Paractinoplanes lichenicola]|uniref:Alkaline phosphatase D family protein n=1 Tax=Paractinoplanes lichenicola TaxID=2802976 RepID=A0ABS1VSG3_9ACTN|nr:alkaline phosphatase D family protein [Actinoplanes lichenicola]MBL7256947.1 alkaline phosphatase D family protein [Actinoplanes lichenicola]
MSLFRESKLSRRVLLTGGAAAVGAPMLLNPEGGYAQTSAPVPADVFRLGVASGDPLPDSVVLWTRLAPDPLAGGGMPDRPVTVQWEIADNDRFTRHRRTGTAVARPELGHSVHVDVRGLRADSVYFYRFRIAGQLSPVGRTRTAPASSARPRTLRFAFASCQDYQAGFYTAYQHLAAEDLAFVAFLGDYIYEGPTNPAAARQHEGTGEPTTLAQYRNRHAQYKTDADLQAAHAAFPWIVTFDDHEVDNNWADEIPQDPDLQTPSSFRARRIAAFQAYYEHMPLRRSSLPRGLDMQLYRRFRFGSLASVHVLDTRQYRSDQPATLADAQSPSLTMTGAQQEKWLVDGLRRSGSNWNLLANQVMWAQNDRTAGPTQTFDFDNWDGYRVQRKRLLEYFGSGRVDNPVVLTGDRHCTWISDLRPDFDDVSTPIVGAELTGTSITSGGNANTASFHATYDPIMAESPHWRYIDNQRGYVVCDVTRSEMVSRLRLVDTVWAPTATVRTAATFVVESGRPGIASVSAEATPPAVATLRAPAFAVEDDQP